MAGAALYAQEFQLEKVEKKTILLFTPHPDDDTFCCAGTLALLARRQNNIHIVIYTNDDKGSYDPDMSSERLARIRQAGSRSLPHYRHTEAEHPLAAVP